jgi:hypothetical protein
LRIILPGLLWPAADTAPAFKENELPSLMWLLGRAERSACPPARPAHAFAAALGLGEIAAAAIRRAGEADGKLPAPGEHWLCADPVTLRFLRDQLVLSDAREIALDADEAASLQAAAKTLLTEVGEFELCSPERGYLRLTAPADAEFSPVEDVAGRPVALFLPDGRKALRWGRILNSLQIDLHELDFNQRRDDEGRFQANSLWFWGEGEPLAAGAKPYAGAVLGDTLLGRGAARLAGNEARPLADIANAGNDTLVLDDSLQRGAMYREPQAWRDALVALETKLFAPLAAALKAGRISRITLEAPGDRSGNVFEITPRKWAFWLKPATPAVLQAPPA